VRHFPSESQSPAITSNATDMRSTGAWNGTVSW